MLVISELLLLFNLQLLAYLLDRLEGYLLHSLVLVEEPGKNVGHQFPVMIVFVFEHADPLMQAFHEGLSHSDVGINDQRSQVVDVSGWLHYSIITL